MKNTASTGILRKISWMIGFFLLIFISISINNYLKELASTTYKPTPYMWATAVIPIVIGAYIALLFIKQFKLKLNMGLFIFVTIPCLLLTLYYPIITIFPSVVDPLPFLMSASLIQFTSEEIFGVVAGLTLVLSLFKQNVA